MNRGSIVTSGCCYFIVKSRDLIAKILGFAMEVSWWSTETLIKSETWFRIACVTKYHYYLVLHRHTACVPFLHKDSQGASITLAEHNKVNQCYGCVTETYGRNICPLKSFSAAILSIFNYVEVLKRREWQNGLMKSIPAVNFKSSFSKGTQKYSRLK